MRSCPVASPIVRRAQPRETLDAPVRLEVAGPVALGTTSRSVDAVEPKLLFEDARKRLKRRNGLVGVMDLQRLGMDLVHRHVKMLVLLLAMADRDVLVLSEPRRLHRPANDVLELRRRQASVLGVKRDDQVIGLVALGPHIALLEHFHDLDRKLGVFSPIEALQVPGHVPGASLLALSSQHVRNELAETRYGPAVPRLLRRDDHRERTSCARTRRSSAALRSTSTRVRRSSAFSSRSVSAFLSKPPRRFCSRWILKRS